MKKNKIKLIEKYKKDSLVSDEVSDEVNDLEEEEVKVEVDEDTENEDDKVDEENSDFLTSKKNKREALQLLFFYIK